MSHEVRTPLNAIIGMGGEVDTSMLSVRDRERMAIVRRSAGAAGKVVGSRSFDACTDR